MRIGAAQVLHRDFLVRGRLDDVGAGDEHVGSFPRHENEIRNRRRIYGAARARPHDRADLRNHAARQRVAQKNIGVTRQRHHTLLDARAARIIQADHRRAVAHRQVHYLADLERVGFRERSAKHGEILRKNIDQPAVDTSVAGDEAIPGRPLVLHPKIIAAVRNELVELLKGALIEKQRHALARRELAGLMLALAAFGTAAGFRLGSSAAQVLQPISEFWIVGHRVLPSRLSHRLEWVRH